MNSKEEKTVKPMEDPDMEWAKLETMYWDLLSSKEELEDRYFNFLLEEFLKGGFLYIDKYKCYEDNDDENEALSVAKKRMRLYIKERLSFLKKRKEELESRIRTKDLLKHLT